MYQVIVNANIIKPTGIVFDGKLVIKGGRIVDILKKTDETPADATVIDAKGAYLGPGFVDIHTHGFGNKATYDADAGIVDHFLKHGTTTFLATPYYSLNLEQNLQAIEDAKAAMKKSPVIKGIYMEGPYTNPIYGANAAKNPWLHGIIESEYKALVDACGTDVKVWTVAPELAGIDDFCAYAKKVNPQAVIALGHSEATPDRIEKLGKNKPSLMTHIMNATGRPPMPKGTRAAGPDEYCLARPDMYAELICDSCGIHVNSTLQRMILQAKGVDKLVLISDSCMIDSPSPERFRHITDLNFDDHGDLAGSQLSLDMACRNIMAHTNCGIVQAFIMASLNPAKVIGLDSEIGSIEIGKVADLVFVDDKFNVLNVMTEGKLYE